MNLGGLSTVDHSGSRLEFQALAKYSLEYKRNLELLEKLNKIRGPIIIIGQNREIATFLVLFELPTHYLRGRRY